MLVLPVEAQTELSPATTQPLVTVSREPAIVEIKQFDGDNPPGDLPLNPSIEAAASAATFTCESNVHFLIRSESAAPEGISILAQVSGIQVVNHLKVILWLPQGFSEKLKSHEQGHAEISKRFYDQGEAALKNAAAAWLGRTLQASGLDEADALHNATTTINDRLSRSYLSWTSLGSAPVQKVYDDLTDHGRNHVPESKAIALAMRRAVLPPYEIVRPPTTEK